MLLRQIGSVCLAGVVALGCTGSPDESDPSDEAILDGSAGKADQISFFDDPSSLIPNAKTALKDIITAADVGKDFGVEANRIPYPDTYWPMVDGGIDFDWTGDGSPLAKYMQLFDPSRVAEAQAWEKANHGKDVPEVADWFGHCPGWTGSALVNAPLQKPIFVKSDGRGDVATCAEGSAGCVKLEIGDINALQAEVFNDGDSDFIGARCDTAPDKIKRDRAGRIKREGNGEGCKGLNPGSLMIVAGNLMKAQKKPFAIDAQNEANTDQIWNQPAYSYHVYRFENLTKREAANLVGSGGAKRTGWRWSYPWNSQAKGFVLVDIGLKWITETPGPNLEVVSGADQTKETRMVAVIELSAAPTDAAAKIIGGEYLDDASVGANRLRVAPFVWTARGPGPERAFGDGHNPFVKPSIVLKLVSMAQ